MSISNKSGEHFIQIGMTALRDPTGVFLPAVPLYIKVEPDQISEKTNMSPGEEKLCTDIAGIFANKFAQYVRAARKQQGKKTERNPAVR